MIGRPSRVRTVILALVTLMIALGLFIFPVGDYGRGVRGIARCKLCVADLTIGKRRG